MGDRSIDVVRRAGLRFIRKTPSLRPIKNLADLRPLYVHIMGNKEKYKNMNIVQATQHVLEHSKDILLGSLPISNSGDIHEHPIAAPSGSSVLVDDWDCLRDMIDTWESTCGTLGQYGMRHSRTFANLCNLGFDSKHILTAAEAIC